MFALQFVRINGRDYTPAYTPIPAGVDPQEELDTFLGLMDAENIPHSEIANEPGSHAVHMEHAEQVWKVKIIDIESPIDYQDTAEVVIGANDFGTEVYSK